MVGWMCTSIPLRRQGIAHAYVGFRRLSTKVSISDILKKGAVPERAIISGYVRSIRRQKRIAFVVINDGSSSKSLQAVMSPQAAEDLSVGCAIEATGALKPSIGKGQALEFQTETIKMLGDNDAQSYPIQKKYHSPEFLRTIPHLRCRTSKQTALLRLRSQVIASITNHFHSQGFVQTHPPVITSSDCEGAGEVFTVIPKDELSRLPEADGDSETDVSKYFRSEKYLTVSSQLHLETLAQSVGHVWTLSPTFRAERSDTARHLSEFYMLEAEMAFTRGLDDIMDVVEATIRAATSILSSSELGRELIALHEPHGIDVQDSFQGVVDLRRRWAGLLSNRWPRVSFQDALSHLREAVDNGTVVFESGLSTKDGFHTEHERYLARTLGNEGPLFVTDYPKQLKPFYMAPSAEAEADKPTVACFDLLVPELCEIAGGSLREHRLEPLQESMHQRGMSLDALQWYLDLRRYGSVPHGGFGIGFDRLLCYLAGIDNIRDMVPFPRWYGRCLC